MNVILDKYHKWKYRNTALLFFSLILLLAVADSPFVKALIVYIGNLGYLGIFFTGMFFVSTFTVAPASIVLFLLSENTNLLTLSLVAGLGASVGDLLLLKFFKERIFVELFPLFKSVVGLKVLKLFKTPYFTWLYPVIGVLIIASPFPDEIGIGLLGISKLSNWQFYLISLICNTLGILLVISLFKSA